MKQSTINVPGGSEYTIREQTGADDDLLSKIDVDEATSLNRYLASIILSGPDGSRLTLEDVEKLRLRDKYVILIKSRIYSLSDKLFFNYTWPGDTDSLEYEVDLTEFIWDYTTPPPKLGEEGFSPLRIAPYMGEDEVAWNLGSGQSVSFNVLTGIGEKYLLELKPNDRSINKQLVARGFKVDDGSKMVTVRNFVSFSSRDMMEIRNKVDEADPPVKGEIIIHSPTTGEAVNVPLIGIKDFFYPVKI